MQTKKKLFWIGALMLALALLLTMAPACGNGDDEETTPTPGFTPMPGVTPTPTPEAKTVKIGISMPLSGPAAPWGKPLMDGANWAVDRINESGGVKVGDDTYMIDTVSCDDGFSASGAGECVTRFAYDEKVKYMVGPIAYAKVALPIIEPENIFMTDYNLEDPDTSWHGPEHPYYISTLPTIPVYDNGYIDAAIGISPEVKTIVYVIRDAAGVEGRIQDLKDYCASQGVEVIGSSTYATGTVDFYPTLTGLISKDPDAVYLDQCPPGDTLLLVKQTRELGYDGAIWSATSVSGIPGPEVSVAWAENMLTTRADFFDSDFWSQETTELYVEFNERYPEYEGDLPSGLMLSFATINLYAAAWEQAGSIDPAAVRAVLDDPNFRFNYFGYESKMGGLETFGIRCKAEVWYPFSRIENGVFVQKGLIPMYVP